VHIKQLKPGIVVAAVVLLFTSMLVEGILMLLMLVVLVLFVPTGDHLFLSRYSVVV
jgi:hypothetical protein